MGISEALSRCEQTAGATGSRRADHGHRAGGWAVSRHDDPRGRCRACIESEGSRTETGSAGRVLPTSARPGSMNHVGQERKGGWRHPPFLDGFGRVGAGLETRRCGSPRVPANALYWVVALGASAYIDRGTTRMITLATCTFLLPPGRRRRSASVSLAQTVAVPPGA